MTPRAAPLRCFRCGERQRDAQDAMAEVVAPQGPTHTVPPPEAKTIVIHATCWEEGDEVA